MREINLLIWDQHVALLWAALRDERSGGGGGVGGVAIVKVVFSPDVMLAFDLIFSIS